MGVTYAELKSLALSEAFGDVQSECAAFRSVLLGCGFKLGTEFATNLEADFRNERSEYWRDATALTSMQAIYQVNEQLAIDLQDIVQSFPSIRKLVERSCQ